MKLSSKAIYLKYPMHYPKILFLSDIDLAEGFQLKHQKALGNRPFENCGEGKTKGSSPLHIPETGWV